MSALFCVYDYAGGKRCRFLMMAPLDIVEHAFHLRAKAMERIEANTAENRPTCVFFDGRTICGVEAIELELAHKQEPPDCNPEKENEE